VIFKVIAFLAAAIPIFLFVRSIFFRRTTRINEGLREFKKQANLAVARGGSSIARAPMNREASRLPRSLARTTRRHAHHTGVVPADAPSSSS
jgi:hypothetical protein